MRISLNLPSPLLASIPESMNIRRQTSDFSVLMSVWALGRGKSFGKQMFILFFCLKPIHQFTLDGQVLPKELLGNNERKYRLGEWHRQRKGLRWEDVSMTVLGKRMWQTAHCCRPQVSASLFFVFYPLNNIQKVWGPCSGPLPAEHSQNSVFTERSVGSHPWWTVLGLHCQHWYSFVDNVPTLGVKAHFLLGFTEPSCMRPSWRNHQFPG